MKKLATMRGAIFCGALVLSACDTAETIVSNPNQPTRITISKNGYEPKEIKMKKGQPVKLEFHRADGDNCGEELVFPKLNIRKNLPVGATETVEFTAHETGELRFTCGMDMLRGKVIVTN